MSLNGADGGDGVGIDGDDGSNGANVGSGTIKQVAVADKVDRVLALYEF